MRLIFYLYLFSSLVNAGIDDQTESKMDKGIEELDDDITLEKKSLMILTADADDDQEIAERVLSISGIRRGYENSIAAQRIRTNEP